MVLLQLAALNMEWMGHGQRALACGFGPQLRVLVVGVVLLGPSNGAGGPWSATHGVAGPRLVEVVAIENP